MFTVLIAEDELLVRLGLKNSVDWQKYDMHVIADVNDGAKAWDAYIKHKPDILITDLRMPNIDGMELIERIRSLNNDTYIIIISCLEEFDLVKKALSKGVMDYVTKATMTEGQLDACLEKAAGALKARGMRGSASVPDQYHARAKLVLGVLTGELHPAEFKNGMTGCGWADKPWQIRLALMRLNEKRGNAMPVSSRESRIARQTVLDLFGSSSTDNRISEIYDWEDGYFVFVYGTEPSEDSQKARKNLQAVIEKTDLRLKNYFNKSISVAVSSAFTGIESVSSAYTQCCSLMKKQYFTGLRLVFGEDEPDSLALAGNALQVLKSRCGLFESLDPNTAATYRKIMIRVEESLSRDRKDIEDELMVLVQYITGYFSKYASDIIEAQAECNRYVLEADTFSGAVDAVIEFLSACEVLYIEKCSYRKEISEALRIIKESSDREITMTDIARKVGFSPNYFSTQFKKETGENFNRYLVLLRLGKAEKMMLDSSMKLSEISRLAGFSDETYFNRVFHKLKGITPGEWRERQLAKGSPQHDE